MKAQFESDKVKVRTGNVDNGGSVTFEIGEYMIPKIKELVGVEVGKVLKVTVEYD